MGPIQAGKSPFYSMPLPDNCVMTPIFQDGSLPFQYTHKKSSPLQQALHTQIAIFNKLEIFLVFFFFLSVEKFLQSSTQPHKSAAWYMPPY